MTIIYGLLRGLSTLISLYTIICFARIFLTWIPSLQGTAIARVLASLCDPYLYLFKKLKFLRFNTMDFSPIVAIGILVMTSTLLSNIIAMERISVGIILAMILSLAWNLVSSILNFLIILMVIRLIFLLIHKDSGTIWYSFDQILSPITGKIAKLFFSGRFYTQQTALIISIISLVLGKMVVSIGINYIVKLFIALPI